jgi:mannose-6-phosphate isomerase-like protein (cupin superfamily)
MIVRRVVTGHSPSGRSVFVSDEQVRPVETQLMPSAEFHQLWGGDITPTFPDDGAMPAYRGYFPPVGGFRFGMFSIPPAGTAGPLETVDVPAALADTEEKLPGLVQYMELDNPGMHTTDTIDFDIVLEGTVVLEVDDGAQVTLRPGDTVVQNGTRHRWSNPGDTVARLAYLICGAAHGSIAASS